MKQIKCLLSIPLVFINVSSGIALSQPLQIPVIPYDEKPPHVSYKVHNRCKPLRNYWKCIDRSEKKFTTSLDMDY